VLALPRQKIVTATRTELIAYVIMLVRLATAFRAEVGRLKTPQSRAHVLAPSPARAVRHTDRSRESARRLVDGHTVGRLVPVEVCRPPFRFTIHRKIGALEIPTIADLPHLHNHAKGGVSVANIVEQRNDVIAIFSPQMDHVANEARCNREVLLHAPRAVFLGLFPARIAVALGAHRAVVAAARTGILDDYTPSLQSHGAVGTHSVQ
jgi:hypothetical protein